MRTCLGISLSSGQQPNGEHRKVTVEAKEVGKAAYLYTFCMYC